MAETLDLVSSLLQKTYELLAEELSLPQKVKNGIKNLETELKMLRAFLAGMKAQGKQVHGIQEWIKLLQDIDKSIEVAIDMFARQNALKKVRRYDYPSRIRGRHSINNLIQEIEANIKSITYMRVRYPIDLSSHPASASSYSEAAIASLYTPEEEIVGFEEARKELADWVLEVEKLYKVMFLVGMGGSGMSTLAHLVYEQLKEDFDCCLWLSASEYTRSIELLSAMVIYLGIETQPPSGSSLNQIKHLIDVLNDYLRDKRCLIVLDGLRNTKVWNSFTHVIPKNKCSRVIITTRRGDIASSCRQNSVDIYKVQALPSEKARELFHRVAFPGRGLHLSAPCLPSICEQLLEKCEGLPLGIVEIGRYFSNRMTSDSEPGNLDENLQSELASGQLSRIKEVLLLSYNDLPDDHLKKCFLYMSMFPASYSVKRRILIRQWKAAGFIQRSTRFHTPEDIGEEYLKELMERNLIQASELDFDGRPKTCRLHNLMHMIALSISKADGFCTTGGDVSESTRRLSIQNSRFEMPKEILHHAHTLLTTGVNLNVPPGISISKMRLLKILHLDHANVDALPSGIEKLLLLKYLSLRKTRIKEIPESTIGKLQLLETLDLKQTFVTTMPKDLEKLEKLRDLLVCRYIFNGYLEFDAVQGFDALPEIISKLTNLQKLSFIRADKKHKLIQVLQKLTQLRKLGIIDLPSDSGQFLCPTIQMLRDLRSLNLTSLHRNEVLKIQDINNPPPLQRLYLKGYLEKMPHWISKLKTLQRMRLKWSRLTCGHNPITVLGELDELLELQLLDAYTGSQLDFDFGKFRKLKILEFERMENLEFIIIEDGALPCLQKLIIRKCQKLRFPVGIDSITQLKELDLSDMPSDFVDPLRRNGAMRHLVQHIGKICSRSLQYDNQWTNEYLQ